MADLLFTIIIIAGLIIAFMAGYGKNTDKEARVLYGFKYVVIWLIVVFIIGWAYSTDWP